MAITDSDQKLQLGQLLVKNGALTREQLEEALHLQHSEENRQLLGEVLIQKGFCAEEQIMECLAKGYGIPFVRVSPKVADPKVLEVLPRDFLKKHCILPLFKVRGTLTLAVSEPANVFLIEEVARMADCEVQIACATAKDIHNTLETHLPSANVFVIDDSWRWSKSVWRTSSIWRRRPPIPPSSAWRTT